MKFFRRAARRDTRRGLKSIRPVPRSERPRAGAARHLRSGRPGLPSWPRSLRLTPPRAAAILGILASVGGLYGLAATPAFKLDRLDLPALQWTTKDAVVAAVSIPAGTNLFRIETGPIEDRLRSLPGVAEAHVTLSLPDTLVVKIKEREAIVTWRTGESLLLVDRAGVIFGAFPIDSASAPDLPIVTDTRPTSAALGIGSTIDPLDLDAVTRLGSVTPTDIGSRATSLLLTITEARGFEVRTVPASWVAVFGLYTPSLRTPAIIPGQVRLLRSLLKNREDAIATIFLPDEKSGTYVPKATGTP